jgi:Predicted translation initiation factor 2B subunit, eIF-2B alpha/beta/delta family
MSDISKYLPSLLQHDEICLFNGKALVIGDRRALPFEKKSVVALDVESAAAAISDMVTQGGGPLEVALGALRLVASKKDPSYKDFAKAVEVLAAARKTNTTMARTLRRLLVKIEEAYQGGTYGEEFVNGLVDAELDKFDDAYLKIGTKLETLISDGDGILTTCFAEHSFFIALALAKAHHKAFKLYVPETRPYLQGAHLTAPAAYEMGYETVLITDAMPAHFMSAGRIQKYITASDLALEDGTIVNKVGTLENAIAAKYYNIPYYATSLGCDTDKKDRRDIVVEYRSPLQVKEIQGVKTTLESLPALYPCFDVIDQSLVTNIITPEGILCTKAQ